MHRGRNFWIRFGTILFATDFLILCASDTLQADHNKLLQREFKRAISQDLACDNQGRCYLLLPWPTSDNARGFELRVSRKPHPKSISDFSLTVPLPSLPGSTETSVFSAGLAVDPNGLLHVIWTTKQAMTAYSVVQTQTLRSGDSKPKWLNPANGQEGALVLGKSQSWAGGICRSPNGQVWLTWITAESNSSDMAVQLGTIRDGKWQSFELGRGKKFYPPALLFSDDGKFFHVACGDTIGFTHYLKERVSELNAGRKRKFERSHSGHRPALAETADGILAVQESGDSLKYTFINETRPRRSHPLTDLDSRLVWDTVHSPQQVVDQHAVPWVFFIDSTRQHVFYSRWLGTRWSPMMNGFWLTRNTARFEDNHVSIDWLGVKHGIGTDNSSIGLVIGNRSQFPSVKFHVLRVPSIKSDPGKKVLFLDLKEVQHIDGVDLQVNTARKLPEPVITGGRAGEFDSQGAATVAVHKQNGIYRAWYTGLYREPGSQWPKSGAIPYTRVGYAESTDGRNFKKKPLGLSPFGKNDKTNIVAGLPATPIFRPIVPTGMHMDSSDPDPNRRYKFLTWSGGRPVHERAGPGRSDANSQEEADAQTWTLWTSPDGIRWREASRGGIRYPGGMPASFSPQSLFHDPAETDPARKYKAYGFLGLNNDRRGGGYGYSADAIEWTADPSNPIFDPWARATPVVRNGKVHQIHDVVVWKYHQYYLAMYQYQHSGDDMTIELAMSRDGENFTFIKPGAEIVRRGAAGEWDSDSIAPSVPLVDDNEIKMYYSGYRFSRTKLIEGERACGLATLRLDGFTHLSLEDGKSQGSVTTIPVERGAAKELYLNALCGNGSRIEVELIDPATGKVIDGFSRENCTAVDTDSLAHRIAWGNRRLADVRNASFQLRFHFKKGRGSPALYSFEFR